MLNISVSNSFEYGCTRNRLCAISFYFIIAMLASVMTIVTIVLNCIFIATLLSHKLIHKSISNTFLVVLSLVDLLQGVSTWPVTAANFFMLYRLDINHFLWKLNYIFGYCLIALTVTTIFIIAVEQYIAILHPYFYISNVTFYHLLGPVLVVNLMLLIINIVGKMKLNQKWNEYYNFTFTALGILMLTAFVYMQTKIIHCVSQVAAKITETNKEEGKRITSRAKAARSGLIVLVATLVCYCPNMFCVIYEKVREPTLNITTYVRYPTEILALFSSIIDPIIYYCRLKSLRKATKHMFASLCRCQKLGHE